MSLTDVIASGVAIANQLTSDLQDKTVTIQFWTGQSGSGDSSYTLPKKFPALVDLSSKPIFTTGGTLLETKAYVAFLEPLPVTTAKAGQIRRQPLDERDIITLPDKTSGPIIKIGGFVNADTHRPYMSEVWLGR